MRRGGPACPGARCWARSAPRSPWPPPACSATGPTTPRCSTPAPARPTRPGRPGGSCRARRDWSAPPSWRRARTTPSLALRRRAADAIDVFADPDARDRVGRPLRPRARRRPRVRAGEPGARLRTAGPAAGGDAAAGRRRGPRRARRPRPDRAGRRAARRGDRPSAHAPRPVPAEPVEPTRWRRCPAGIRAWSGSSSRAAATRSARLLVDAAEALVADEQQSIDNFAWFRGTHDEEERHRDGLVLDGQGFGRAGAGRREAAATHLPCQGDRFWVDRTRDVHTATAAAYGVITVPDGVDDRAPGAWRPAACCNASTCGRPRSASRSST